MPVRDPAKVLSEVTSTLLAGGNLSIPDVLAHSHDEAELRLTLQIDPHLDCFRGHFPGNPILPGVVQLQWAVELARAAFGIESLPQNILRLKFSSVVVPPSRIELVLTQPSRQDIRFLYHGDEATYSQGVLRFDERSL